MKMRRVPDEDIEAVHAGGPGAFCWLRDGEFRSLYLFLPQPAGVSRWAIRPHELPNGHSWEWDGDEDRPTLSPSLHVISRGWPEREIPEETLWHGWVRNGELVG